MIQLGGHWVNQRLAQQFDLSIDELDELCALASDDDDVHAMDPGASASPDRVPGSHDDPVAAHGDIGDNGDSDDVPLLLPKQQYPATVALYLAEGSRCPHLRGSPASSWCRLNAQLMALWATYYIGVPYSLQVARPVAQILADLGFPLE